MGTEDNLNEPMGQHGATTGVHQAPAEPQPPTSPSGTAPSAAVAAPPRKSSGNGWKIALGVIAAIVVLLVAGMASCSSIINSALSDSSVLSSGTGASEEGTVAIINLDGTIEYDGSACSPEGLADLLEQAEEDDSICAVVLRVNSGGGTSTAGEEMSTLIADFSKPVVVSSASINCSAAYMISSQADYIYTAKTSEIGAIGAVMQVTDYSGLLDMLGIDVDNIVSSESKDSSYGTRSLTKGERAHYQDIVDQVSDEFIDTVAEGRGMDRSGVEELATGLPFTGLDAVDNGLADEIGTLEDACAKAAELAGCDSDCETVELSVSDSTEALLELLSSSSDDDDSIMISKSELEAALKELENDGVIQ